MRNHRNSSYVVWADGHSRAYTRVVSVKILCIISQKKIEYRITERLTEVHAPAVRDGRSGADFTSYNKRLSEMAVGVET